jgi:transcriptional regulator with XRE-family HTH domain
VVNKRVRKQLLAQVLKESLEQSGLSQRQLAEKMGKYQNTIYRILAGKKNLTVLELMEFCSICNVSWNKLLSQFEQSITDSTK